jgi:anion-transporting  ArsA/GET3 family ATPase
MPDLLDKRLIFVTGKGGVGKSTVSAALGLAAARRGRRTIVAELSYQDRIARAFHGEDSHFNEVAIGDGLWTISIDPQHALEEYLRIQIRVKAMADLLSGSRMFQYFAVATPGMSELVTMGKVWELAQPERRTKGAARYDVVIVDAPATGHGVGMLTSPRTFAEIARVGPIAGQGRAIHQTVTDPRHTGIVAVALPEEMPVNETLMLSETLERELGMALDRIVVNGLYPERFGPRHRAAMARALETAGSPLERTALRAALSAHARAKGQREQLARLEEATGREPARLPFVFEPELGPDEFDSLSHVLEEDL